MKKSFTVNTKQRNVPRYKDELFFNVRLSAPWLKSESRVYLKEDNTSSHSIYLFSISNKTQGKKMSSLIFS